MLTITTITPVNLVLAQPKHC